MTAFGMGKEDRINLCHGRRKIDQPVLSEKLVRFLEEFHSVRPEKAVPSWSPRQVSPDTLGALLDAIRGPLEDNRCRGNTINPWSIAGVRRKEVINSAILATFWSPRSCGVLARQYLDAFCRRLDDPEGILPTSAELSQPYSIRTEHCPVGEISERVDITIEGQTFVLGVEVKIDAAEGEGQLKRYDSSIKRWSEQRGKRPCVVFLASIEPSIPTVVKAGWPDIVAAGRHVLAESSGARTSHQFMLKSFITHCRQFGG